MTVGIYHKKNVIGLITLLVQLQPQLSPDDDIYIYDASRNQSGLKIARMYGTTRCYIFVEVGEVTEMVSKSFIVENASQNSQDGVLFISENCFISSTFIQNLKKAIIYNHAVVVPKVLECPYERMDSNFKWFNPPTGGVITTPKFNPNCYYSAFTYDDEDISLFDNETVLVLQTLPPSAII